ncbi:MAG: bacteriohemerythrin [Polyangiaceae bacterium]|jgi:hemerythrin
MPLIEWDGPRFSVEVKRFDDDHREMIRLINDLHSAMKSGQARDILSSLTDKLADYAKLHIGDEETTMQRFGYPQLASHRQEHAEFAERVAEIRQQAQAGDVVSAIDLLEFLQAWLFNHILGTDRLYAPFFVARHVR